MQLWAHQCTTGRDLLSEFYLGGLSTQSAEEVEITRLLPSEEAAKQGVNLTHAFSCLAGRCRARLSLEVCSDGKEALTCRDAKTFHLVVRHERKDQSCGSSI